MAEEFHSGGVCGGNWWNSSRNLSSSSPCSSATNGTGSFGWRDGHEMNIDMKTTRSSENSTGSVSDQQPDWHKDLHHDTARLEETYSQMVKASGALNSSMKYRHQTRGIDRNEMDSKINDFCGDFSINSGNFPPNSASYGYTSSYFLRTLLDAGSDHPPKTLFDDQETNYMSSTNFSNELMSSSFPKASPMEFKAFVAKQQPDNRLQFSNNTPFQNAMAWPGFIHSTPSQYTSSFNNFPSTGEQKRRRDESKNLASSAKKSSGNGPALKHPGLETPSPLPTFKVRKEKLGDRITALQQLVSPFGKTDTASVLYEAIEYIKFLHDQVNVLSTPYLTNGTHPFQQQQVSYLMQDHEEDVKKDLRSRGLCLVPISSTFPVAAENTSDFWTPTLGRSFR